MFFEIFAALNPLPSGRLDRAERGSPGQRLGSGHPKTWRRTVEGDEWRRQWMGTSICGRRLSAMALKLALNWSCALDQGTPLSTAKRWLLIV